MAVFVIFWMSILMCVFFLLSAISKILFSALEQIIEPLVVLIVGTVLVMVICLIVAVLGNDIAGLLFFGVILIFIVALFGPLITILGYVLLFLAAILYGIAEVVLPKISELCEKAYKKCFLILINNLERL